MHRSEFERLTVSSGTFAGNGAAVDSRMQVFAPGVLVREVGECAPLGELTT